MEERRWGRRRERLRTELPAKAALRESEEDPEQDSKKIPGVRGSEEVEVSKGLTREGVEEMDVREEEVVVRSIERDLVKSVDEGRKVGCCELSL